MTKATAYSLKQLKKHYDELWHRKDTTKSRHFKIRAQRMESLLSHVPLTLDLGCGDGVLTLRMITKVNEVVAVDVSINALRKAKSKLKKYPVHFVVADAQGMPFKGETFDQIICGELIEHLLEPKKALKEGFRVSKIGATLILSTPNRLRLQKLWWRGYRTLSGIRSMDSNYLMEFSWIETKYLVEHFGFKVTQITGDCIAPSILPTWIGEVAPYFANCIIIKAVKHG